MCGNKDCGYQQECTTYSSKAIRGLATVTVNVAITRKRSGSGQGFKDCWAGTENIINQCIYSEKKLGGTWVYDGQVYQVNAWFS
ncbi:hypothetical protein EDB81DRAFT_874107 [Dactylonectria macrodidyma]|uniref:Uncharacterized protein n=1 Tax=Dactylonectria macrodidyma TaxID=307937 RepID=A0A9P9FQF9_9HYPO|nr:hypothetical protein EDB81DRAFT_874107 [Dactylonectria macrodidyma]